MKDEILSVLKKYCKDCDEQLRIIAGQAFADCFYVKNFNVFHIYPFPPPNPEIYQEIYHAILEDDEDDDADTEIEDGMDDNEYKEFLYKRVAAHHGKRTILELDIRDPLNFAEIWLLSHGLREIYAKFEYVDKMRKVDFEVFLDTEHFRRDIQSKYFELVGYWTAKMEESRRNKKAVSIRTEKKEEKKAVLSDNLGDLQPGDKNVFGKWLVAMACKLDCSENNIRQLLKELKV